ncbi:MAG: hypothetical protein C5B58_08710 [Acidobacteria bacterium]|nr:MAG: hypothetical protein C5B58_08710 [Acidobacteriota bacterium]
MKGKLSIVLTAAASMTLVCFTVHAAAEAQCSNRTLQGSYGFTIDGTIVGPNIPFRGLALQHYDGHGNITQVDRLVENGVAPSQEWLPGSGTYTVNPDCTGSAVINSQSTPFPIALHFVIVDNGNEIRQVVDANAVIAIGKRVFQSPSSDSQN